MKRLFQFFIFAILSLMILSLCGCEQHSSRQAQGYIEGRFTFIASQVEGQLIDLFVKKGQTVEKDQPLFKLDIKPQVYDVNRSQAQVYFTKRRYERNKKLFQRKAVGEDALDESYSEYEVNEAELEKNQWQVSQKEIKSPISGFVFDTLFRVGEVVEKDSPVLMLLSPKNIYAVFFVPQHHLSSLKLQQAVQVKCDGCKQAYQGKISFISPEAEYTPPVIYSEQTRSKLIYRIEAHFDDETAEILHPGQPISVKY